MINVFTEVIACTSGRRAMVVACVIGSVAGFIWGICDLPSIDDIFKRAAEFALIFIFLAVSGVISFINRLFK